MKSRVGFVLVFFFALTFHTTRHSLAVVAIQNGFICDQASYAASINHNVPFNLLKAVTRTETARTVRGELRPWPWTLNVEGHGIWFQSRSEALNYLRNQLSVGKQSVDVGCFQINTRWHLSNFSSLGEMLDPVSNANYAAFFLRNLFEERNNWTEAVGAYHSLTQKHAQRYIQKYNLMLSQVEEVVVPSVFPNRTPNRLNGFPLLHGAANNSTKGSLFPTDLERQDSILGTVYWE